MAAYAPVTPEFSSDTPVLATRENGGWQGGTWLPSGLGYGGRNHGWGATGAGAWYAANGYVSDASNQFPACTSRSVDTALLAAFLTLAIVCMRQQRALALAAALLAGGMAVRVASVPNAVDVAFVLEECATLVLVGVHVALASSATKKFLPGNLVLQWIPTACHLTLLALPFLAPLSAFDRTVWLMAHIVNTVAWFWLAFLANAVLPLLIQEKVVRIWDPQRNPHTATYRLAVVHLFQVTTALLLIAKTTITLTLAEEPALFCTAPVRSTLAGALHIAVLALYRFGALDSVLHRPIRQRTSEQAHDAADAAARH